MDYFKHYFYYFDYHGFFLLIIIVYHIFLTTRVFLFSHHYLFRVLFNQYDLFCSIWYTKFLLLDNHWLAVFFISQHKIYVCRNWVSEIYFGTSIFLHLIDRTIHYIVPFHPHINTRYIILLWLKIKTYKYIIYEKYAVKLIKSSYFFIIFTFRHIFSKEFE